MTDMSKICSECHRNPSSHSFSKLCKTNGVHIFYTKPADAEKYDDTDGIIHHIDRILSQYDKKEKWAWIIDTSGFEYKHMLQINLTKRLIELINNKYISTLEYIHVKNINTYVNQLVTLLTPFLRNTLIGSKVRFD